MEPLEILGAAAAAGQFANQALKITILLYTTISRLSNASKVQKERSERISQLEVLLRAVISHKSFQTDLVAAELSQCLQDLTLLNSIIIKLDAPETASRWKRYPKKLLALLKDSEINDLFNILERDKGSLALALQSADSQLLGDMGINIESIHGHVSKMSIVLGEIADGVQRTSTAVPEVLQKLDSLDSSLSRMAVSAPEEPFVNFPMSQAMKFIGRSDTLATMRRCLSDKIAFQTSCIVLKGLPGQGKSALAIEYCSQTVQDTYQSILWIDASSEDSIDNEFTDIAAQILDKQSPIPATPKGKSSAIFRKLAADKVQWLVVFDGFGGFRSVPRFQDYLPSSPNASIIITTRRQDISKRMTAAQELEIGPMKSEDAIELLTQASQMDRREEGCLFNCRWLLEESSGHCSGRRVYDAPD